jgi:hypothetical protein
MDLEFHQIDLRYEHLRKQDAAKERALLASLDMLGQACPVVVLAQEAAAPFVLVDGYKRLRVLKRLHRDTVRATVWDLAEADALLLERMLRTSRSESQLEQGWLLRELRNRFKLTLEELGDRFERTPSWVSRRLGLVHDLPEAIQEEVRRGRLAAHTAMKVLLPLARANRADALRFLEVLLRAACSTREAVALQAGWHKGGDPVRARILADPRLFLQARAAAQAPDPVGKTGLALLFDDLGALAALARRAAERARNGALGALQPGEAQDAERALHQARSEGQALFTLLEKELSRARSGSTDRHPAA